MVLNSEGFLFVGVAQSQAPTLQKLATDTLDMSWPNWRNYENPECCIIPPIFYYTNPEKSDQDCHDEKEKLRQSEWAEHIVYMAISASAQKKRAAPILVVHSLNLNRIRYQLPHIFPTVQINQSDPFLREYDFVLIGPQIGLVVIEVKSSEFTGASDFKSKHLPKDYSHGIKQLQYFAENFVQFLQECTGIKWPEESPVRRILFMPNLERVRHENWRQSLGKHEKAEPGSFDHSDAHTIKWYKCDLDNGGKELEALPTFSKLLDGEHGQQISGEIYEAYASVIAALASLIVFKGQSNTKLDPLKLFEKDALAREADRIETQDFAGLLKKGNVKVESLKYFSKVVLPTRQQLEALNGPNRQFIQGPAGCGKTVVLQEKALQLLRNGLKVLIVAPESFVSRYKELLDLNCLNSYEVRPLQTIRKAFPHEKLAQDIFFESYRMGTDPVEAIYNHLKSGKDENSDEWKILEIFLDRWIAAFDAILIDDAIDQVGEFHDQYFDHWNSLVIELTIMAYSEIKFPDQTLWIALDPLMTCYDVDDTYRRRFKWIFGHVFEKRGGQKWSSSVLDNVMRSSENIFQVVYENNVKAIPELRIRMRPSIGHKVVGPEVTQLHLDSYGIDIAQTLWASIKLELEKLLAQKIPLSYISIVLGGSTWCRHHVMRFLIEQLHGCGIPFTSSSREGNKNTVENYQQDEIFWNTYGTEGVLSINYWDEVSSLEWPIVIYAEGDEHGLFDNTKATHQRYRGCSRATTKLIEIIEYYDIVNQMINSDAKRHIKLKRYNTATNSDRKIGKKLGRRIYEPAKCMKTLDMQ